MRGSVTKNRVGLFPNFLLNWLIQPKRVRRNIKNPAFTHFILFFVGIYDLIRERILKPVYRSLPLGFKIWYDQVRYKA